MFENLCIKDREGLRGNHLASPVLGFRSALTSDLPLGLGDFSLLRDAAAQAAAALPVEEDRGAVIHTRA